MKLTQVCRCGEEILFELTTDEILSSLAKWFVTEKLKAAGWDVVKRDILCPECIAYMKSDEEFNEKYAKQIKETDDSDYLRFATDSIRKLGARNTI